MDISEDMEIGDHFVSVSKVGLLVFLLVFRVSSLRTKKFIEPRFKDVGNNVTYHRGETAILPCTVDNLGPRTVVWRKEADDFILSIGKMMYAQIEEMSIDYEALNNDRTRWDLIIKRAQPHHSGTYECQISAAKIYTYYVRLTVLDTPIYYEPTVSLYGTQYISKYQRINLTCNATGAERAPAMIDWFFKGEIIRPHQPKWGGRLVITRYHPDIPGRSLISQLTIERGLVKDSGDYICRSSDEKIKSIKVHVFHEDKSEVNKRDKNGMNTMANTDSQRGNSGVRHRSSSAIVVVVVGIVLMYINR